MFHHDRAQTGRSDFSTASNPGFLKWTFAPGDSLMGEPMIAADGIIYVATGSQKLYAINPDGTLKWKFITDGTVSGPAAIDSEGTIYIGSVNLTFYSVTIPRSFL